MRARRFTLLFCGLFAVPAFLPPAPQEQRPASPARVRDSIYTLNNARNALRVHLTRVRLYLEPHGLKPLPFVFKCENRVDVYCFGPTNGGTPFGHPNITRAVEFRTSPERTFKVVHKTMAGLTRYLMITLDGFQKKIPGDRWIMGQRVFHLVQHGEIERAQKVARECRSDKWWCASLVGFTSYHLLQFERADSAFAVAMASLPEEDRCRWEGIEDLITSDPDRHWYNGLTCAEKNHLAPNVWWLSDPLFLTPGNERQVAHYFREVSRTLFIQNNEAFSPLQPEPRRSRTLDLGPDAYERPLNDRIFWQHPSVSSLVRSLGVPSFTMGTPAAYSMDAEVLLQYEQPTYHFLPSVATIRAPLSASAQSWDLESPTAIERYHPAFGSFTTLDHQMAWFRRDGHAMIVMAVDVGGNELLGPRSRELASDALFLSRAPGDLRMYRDTIPGRRTTFYSSVPAESVLVSAEAMVAGIGAGRARLASGPPAMPAQRLQLSDLLLLDSPDPLPATLDDAARRARPTTTVSPLEPIGIFWEVYGLARGDSVTFTLSAIEGGRSIVRNIGRFVGILGAEQSQSVRWTEYSAAEAPVPARNIALDLSSLTRGAHTLRLEVRVPGQEPVRVSREIVVRG